MKIGYIRVSTAEQNLDRQELMMKENNVDRVFSEKVSGKDTNRPQLKEMLEFVREGDTIVIESFSRLARSTRDLLKIVDELKEKNVSLISLKENLDTSTPQGKFTLTIFGALAELEREQLKQRQAEGIAIAKEKGLYKGRQPIKVNEKVFDENVKRWKNGEITAVECMKRVGLKPNTFYRRIRQIEENESKSKGNTKKTKRK